MCLFCWPLFLNLRFCGCCGGVRQRHENRVSPILQKSILLGRDWPGTGRRAGLTYLDFRYRSPQFWELAADFWNKTGSITMGFLILLVMIRRFSYDMELRTFPIINSTAYGRLPLFWNRLIGGEVAVVAAVLLLYAGNTGISCLLGSKMGMSYDWTGFSPKLQWLHSPAQPGILRCLP